MMRENKTCRNISVLTVLFSMISLAASLNYTIPVTKLLDNPDRYLPVLNSTFAPYLTIASHQFLLEVNEPGDMAFNFDCTTSLATPNGCQ